MLLEIKASPDKNVMDFSLDRTTEILSATPATIRALLGELSDEWTLAGTRDDWGPLDVVGHLIHCEYTDWIPRARVILAQGEDRNFPPFDRFGHFELIRDKNRIELLAEFDSARRDSVETLRGWKLSEGQLELTGIHPEFGTVTLRQLLATWAVHDLTHIRQISASLAKRYREAVGPWREYLSILK